MGHPQGRHAISFASHINTYMRAMAARLSGKSSRGLENLAKAGEKGTCSRKELLRTLYDIERTENVENGPLEGSKIEVN